MTECRVIIRFTFSYHTSWMLMAFHENKTSQISTVTSFSLGMTHPLVYSPGTTSSVFFNDLQHQSFELWTTYTIKDPATRDICSDEGMYVARFYHLSWPNMILKQKKGNIESRFFSTSHIVQTVLSPISLLQSYLRCSSKTVVIKYN